MQTIKIKNTDTVVYHKLLTNGLNVYFIPYKYKSNYFMSFGTKYGSLMRDFGNKEDKIKSYPLGIAHFLEHKMFETEKGEDPFTFYSASGTDSNANTNYKLTQYICYGNNNIEKNLEFLLDYVSNPYFTDKNVEKEKGIIAQEIEMYDDDPEWMIDEEIRKAMFKVHPIRDDIAGTVKEINKITKEDLYDCYNTFYQPSNMMLFISGKLNVKELEKIVDRYDKKNKSKKTPIYLKKYKEPEKVYKKEIIKEANIAIPKFAYGIKINKEVLPKIDDIKIMMYINMFLNIKFGITSNFREEMRNKELVTSLFVETSMIDNFITMIIFSETKQKDKLQKEIQKELLLDDIKKEDIERLKKVWIASEITVSDNIETIVNNYIYDLIEYNQIVDNRIGIIKELNLKELKDVVSKIDFSNYSSVLLKQKNTN